MLKSILVGLDGTKFSEAATALGLDWAQASGAKLVGQTVVDEPGITVPEPVPMGAAYFKGQRDEELLEAARRRSRQWLAQFDSRCERAGIPFRSLDGTGDPAEVLLAEAQRHDLILLGAETHFRFGPTERPCDTLDKVLHSPPRPVVAVPERLGEGHTVVIGYDGSLQAARTLAAYAATGLATRNENVIVTIDEDCDEAKRIAGRAVDFLSLHGVAVKSRPVETRLDPASILLDHSVQLKAHLLVMGAFGHSALREFFFGSTTRGVLHSSTVPVMLYH